MFLKAKHWLQEKGVDRWSESSHRSPLNMACSTLTVAQGLVFWGRHLADLSSYTTLFLFLPDTFFASYYSENEESSLCELNRQGPPPGPGQTARRQHNRAGEVQETDRWSLKELSLDCRLHFQSAKNPPIARPLPVLFTGSQHQDI